MHEGRYLEGKHLMDNEDWLLSRMQVLTLGMVLDSSVNSDSSPGVRGSLLTAVMIHEWIAASTRDYSFGNEPCAYHLFAEHHHGSQPSNL